MRPLVVLPAVVLLVAGCSGGTESELTVFAAASLTQAFTEIGEAFEEQEGVDVRFSFAGSTDLVAQVAEGAPADVLATADQATMDQAAAQQVLAAPPTAFATNTMEIAVPPDNPAGIASLADTARPDVRLVVCAPQVPCGAATQQVAANSGLTLHPVSEESSVSGVMGKVSAGEADAGFVYVTDVANADGSVRGVAIPADVNVVNTYPVAAVSTDLRAERFIDFVLGPQGREILDAHGFGPP